jgi:deazaflavin-dependent oxidoreductase (nitroreductase family)
MAEPRQRRPMSRLERIGENFAKTRVGGWYYVNVANRADRVLLPLSKGRFSLGGGGVMTVGLLITIGAKSGQTRKTPLTYLPDGDNVVLVASKAGAAKHPAWYHNLKANPEVTFLGKKGKGDYVAHEAEGAEREHLWEEVNDLYAGYDTYQGRAGERQIPVMVLEPKRA